MAVFLVTSSHGALVSRQLLLLRWVEVKACTLGVAGHFRV